MVRRLLLLVLCMFLLSIIVFFMARLAPGDPLQSFYGDALELMTEAEKDAARVRLGLDAGLISQYVHWLGQVMQGDFGLSFKYKMPVLAVMKPLLGNTLLLGFWLISLSLVWPQCSRYSVPCMRSALWIKPFVKSVPFPTIFPAFGWEW